MKSWPGLNRCNSRSTIPETGHNDARSKGAVQQTGLISKDYGSSQAMHTLEPVSCPGRQAGALSLSAPGSPTDRDMTVLASHGDPNE